MLMEVGNHKVTFSASSALLVGKFQNHLWEVGKNITIISNHFKDLYLGSIYIYDNVRTEGWVGGSDSFFLRYVLKENVLL